MRCRSTPLPAGPAAARYRLQRRERLRLVQRREVGQLVQRAQHLVVDAHRARGTARRRARCDGPRRRRRAVLAQRGVSASRSTSLRGASRSCSPSSSSSSPSTRSLRLLDPALTTRTRTRASRTARPSRGRPAGRRRQRACTRGARGGGRPCAGATSAARVPSCGTRSITSITRWKRSMSLSMTMSNGVVVVPSSL